MNFEEQLQELSGKLMFPLATGTLLLFHFGLALSIFPSPKGAHFNAHLQGFLCLFLPYFLFERNGPIGKRYFDGFESTLRRVFSWACMGVYGVLWLMMLADRTLVSARPGARMMGVFMGLVVGTWLGLLSSSAALLLEMMDKQKKSNGSGNLSRPKNRRERRLAARQHN